MNFYDATNDIPSSKNPEVIVQFIVDLAKTVMTQGCRVAVKGIIRRSDQFVYKVREVIDCLNRICSNKIRDN